MRNPAASLCRTIHASDLSPSQLRCLRIGETRATRQGIQILKAQVLFAQATTCRLQQLQTWSE